MPHHDVLLAELAPVAAAVALALVGHFLLPDLRLLTGSIGACSNDGVVASAAGVLLPDKRNRLPHPHPQPGTSSSADSAANPAANPSTDTAKDASSPNTGASACRSSRPLQLRSGHTGQVAGRQEVVVLQDPSRRMPSANRANDSNATANAGHARRASSSCRPLQLR